jgi:hypothetical protein
MSDYADTITNNPTLLIFIGIPVMVYFVYLKYFSK